MPAPPAPLLWLAHGLPVVVLVLMWHWMASALTSYTKAGNDVTAKDMSGFSWATGDGRVFNWHPLLMTFAFLFCSTQAALAYISLPFSHATNKVIHLSLHGVGFLSAVIGVVAVFRFHNEHKITNMYSLHSWLGIFVMVLFGLQFVSSFALYFSPGAHPRTRAKTIPLHIGLGLAILALVFITAATGILEKLAFNASCNVSGTLNGQPVAGFMANDCKLGNTIGFLSGAAFLVVVVTIWYAKHPVDTEQDPRVQNETSPLVRSGAKTTNESVVC